MPATSKASNPQGYEIEFDEASHTYSTKLRGHLTKNGAVVRGCGEFDPNDKTLAIYKYTSGTTFVHHFFPKFDEDGAIANRKARERGVSVDQIRFEWKQKTVAACAMGTRVHETCEDILNNRRDENNNYSFRNQPQSEHERKLMSAGFKACQFILSKFDIVGIEKIIFDLDVQLAGTIDLLAREKSDGTMWILDWKTNNKIEFENCYGSYGSHPISHLKNCSGVHYGLQLSTYEMLMKRACYYPHDTKFRRAIIHLTDDGPKTYELPDYSNEVRDMLVSMLAMPPF